MSLELPETMEECVYFTSRSIGSGHAKAWVLRGECPKCKKGLMGKPLNEKTGKIKIRAKEYVCKECGFSMEKKEHEETLTCNIIYTCPYCAHKGETQVPFKRKKLKGVDSVIFLCDGCGKKLGVTKKMKEPKKKDY